MSGTDPDGRPHRRFATPLVAAMAALTFSTLAAWRLGPASGGFGAIDDEDVSLYEARVHAAGRVFGEQPPVEPWSFRIPMVLDGIDGRRYGKDYPAWPFLLSLGSRGGAEWIVPPMLGGLLVWVTFALARARRGDAVGLAAALFVASSPTMFLLSSTYLNHVAAALFLTAAALAFFRAASAGGWTWGLVSGFAFGAAVASRPYTSVLLGLPLVAAAALQVRNGRPGLQSALGFGAGSAVFAAGILGWNAALTGSPFLTPYELWVPENRPGFFGAVRADHTVERSLRMSGLVLGEFSRRALAVPGLIGAALVLPLVAFRRLSRFEAALVAGSVALIVGHAFYYGIGNVSARLAGGRFYAECIPAAAIVLASAVAALGGRKFGGRVAVMLGAIAMLLSLSRTFPAAIAAAEASRGDPLRRPNGLVGRALAELPPADRLVFFDASTLHASSTLLLNDPGFEGSSVLAIRWEPERNRRVIEAFPGREVLFAWAEGDPPVVRFAPWGLGGDTATLPRAFPYLRWKKRRDAEEARAAELDPRAALPSP